MHKAISNTSGGTGKNDDSAKARKKRAGLPYGVSAHDNTQSYKNLTICTEHLPFAWLHGVSDVIAQSKLPVLYFLACNNTCNTVDMEFNTKEVINHIQMHGASLNSLPQPFFQSFKML